MTAHGGSAIINSGDLTAYNEHYSRKDPFRASAVRYSSPRIVQDEDLLPNEGLIQSDFYRSLISPYGWRYATLIILAVDIRRLEFITIWRSKDQGPMDEKQLGCWICLSLTFRERWKFVRFLAWSANVWPEQKP